MLSDLGACTAITLRVYAEKKGWHLGQLRVELALFKNLKGDASIERVLHCSGALDDAQWARLLEIAGKTSVTQTLRKGSPSARGTPRGIAETRTARPQAVAAAIATRLRPSALAWYSALSASDTSRCDVSAHTGTMAATPTLTVTGTRRPSTSNSNASTA